MDAGHIPRLNFANGEQGNTRAANPFRAAFTFRTIKRVRNSSPKISTTVTLSRARAREARARARVPLGSEN